MSSPEVYFRPLQALLQEASDDEYGKAQSAYMKNIAPFYGIRTPVRRAIFKSFIATYGPPDWAQRKEIVHYLYSLPQRDYHYFALHFLDINKKKLEKDDIKLLEYAITKNAWWDTVDTVAGTIVGVYFKKFPESLEPVTRKWINGTNMWLQRSAIICQLRYRKATNEELLFEYCMQLCESKEFFIRKAIGWALRTYADTNPEAVKQFVEYAPLHSFSKREALRKL